MSNDIERLGPEPAIPDARQASERRLSAQVLFAFGPLRRHRDFRLLMGGQLISSIGSRMAYVAMPFQVFTSTRSAAAVGLLGLCELVPIFLLAIVGGALADSRDRRRMLQTTEAGCAVVALLLAANAGTARPQLVLIYLAAAALAGLEALQRPSFGALLPRIVSREDLVGAEAADTLRMTVNDIVGPVIGGVLIAHIGVAATYILDAASVIASLMALRAMAAAPPPPDAQPPSVRRIVEGFQYARSRPELIGSYVVDLVAMIFGMPLALFPSLASALGGPSALGLLYAAPAAGAAIAALGSGWAPRIRRQGLAITIAAAAWGAAIIGFGLSLESLSRALLWLALAGAADCISAMFRGALWNQTIPDSLRGRLAGIEMLSYACGPALGNFEAGAVGALAGIRASVLSGGILCVLGTATVLVAMPGFRGFRTSSARGVAGGPKNPPPAA